MFTDCIRLTIAAFVYLPPCLPVRGSRLALPLLLLFTLVMGMASPALGGTVFCSEFTNAGTSSDPRYVVDGFNPADYAKISSASTFGIDGNCTIKNFPESSGGFPIVNINYQFFGNATYYINFDNVYYYGNMSCNDPTQATFWIYWAPGGYNNISSKCQDFMVPVDAVVKQNPTAQTTASIGIPFIYTIKSPVLGQLDAGGTFGYLGDADDYPINNVVLADDLTTSGAELSYVSNTAYLVDPDTGSRTVLNGGSPLVLGASGTWLSNHPDVLSDSTKHLVFSYENNPALSSVPAGYNLEIDLTVVLDDTNTPLSTFTNTAEMWFDKTINTINVADLHAWPGTTSSMTIAEPNLVVEKTSSVSNLNVGSVAPFTINLENIGGAAAWNATIKDILPKTPDGPGPGVGGMCNYDPTTGPITAQIVAADSSLVADLTASDYSASFDKSTCELTVALLDTPAAKIEPNEHLIIAYESQLDAGTDSGLTFTNIAGATSWYNADHTIGTRYQYVKPLTNGTPGTVDHEDAYAITSATQGYYFLKSVDDLTSGTFSAATAFPGDRLRYTLQIQNFNIPRLKDITIIDELSADFVAGSLSINSAGTNLPVTPTVDPTGGPNGTGSITISGLTLDSDTQYQLQFDVTLASTLPDGVVVSNQASLSGTDDSNAVWSGISDDPNAGGPSLLGDTGDATTVTIQSPGALAKANPAIKTATIGDQFTYQITVPATAVDVPLYDVQILDDLTRSGAEMSYVSASANLASGSQSWTLINAGSNASDLLLKNTTTGIDIPAGDQAIVEITVQLLNTATNQSDLPPFKNRASYRYNTINGTGDSTLVDGAEGITPDTMSVVEPALTAVKTVSFVSPAGKSPSDSATVGDVLEYAVTITNKGNSTAFDTNIEDALPANVSLDTSTPPTARINGVDAGGFIADPAIQASGALVWGRENGDESLDIPPGQSLVLTYRVRVESATGSSDSNNAYVDWSSLNGESAAERDGEGCPSFTAPNDYCYGPASVGIVTVDDTAITKSVVDDSYAETPASTTDPVVRVGDTVTYDLTLSLQEYTTPNVVVEDTLPQGMALESFTINAGSSFSYTMAAQPTAGDTGTLRWEFGDITNTPSGDGTPIDPLAIQYVAKIVTDAPPTGVAYDASTPSRNTAKLSYTGGDPATYPGRLTASETVDILQPQMSAISKDDSGSGRVGSGTVADPYQVNISADVMNFHLSSCNGGLAPAYGVVVTDRLASQIDEGDLAANPPVVKIGTTILSEGIDYTYSAPVRGGEMRFTLQDSAPVNPEECVTVDYNVGFHTDLTTSTTWNNEAQVAEYRSLPLSEPGRLYASTGTAQVWMTNLLSGDQLLKTLMSPAEATIGDEVVYQIKVPAVPMNAAQDDVVVTDTLNPTLEFVGASAIDSGGAAVSLSDNTAPPGDVSLGISHIPAGEQVIITLRARVVNNDQANAGVSFANIASYTYAGAAADTSSASAPLTVVEPAITLAKSMANVSNPGAAPQAGDILRYSVSFTAAGGVAGDNFSDAFDLSVIDSLSPGLAYRSGTAAVDGTGNAITDPTVTGDGSTTAQTLTWSLADTTADIDVAEGTVVTLTYEVVVLDGVLPGQELTNSVTAQWTGLDGASAFERTGSGTPAENDYFAGPVVLTVMTALSVPFEKSVINVTTGEDPGANAQPGETLRYTLVLTNESVAPLNDATVVDELAAQFAPGTLRLTSVPAGADTSATDASGGGNGTGIVDIRNLTLAAQGNPGDTVSIVFEATLAPVIASGTIVTNRALLTGENLAAATSTETSTVIASAPAFEVWKTSDDLTGDPSVLRAGDTLRYTIVVKNVGNENAVGAVLRDRIPANTTYVAGTTTLNGAPVPDPGSGISPLQDGMTIQVPGAPTGFLPADGTAAGGNAATVVFDVTIDAGVVDGAIISNQGFLNASGEGSGPAPEKPSDDPSTAVPDDPTLDIVGSLPLVDAQKTVEILVDGGSPGIVDPGDVLRYTIAVSNAGSVPATGVVFIDATPANTTYVPDSFRLNGLAVGQPDGGNSPLETGIDVSSSDLTPPLPGAGGGVLSPGSTAGIVFDVRVNDGVAAGTVITNQGTVKTGELSDEPTDVDGIDSNGDQPTEVVVGDVQQLSIIKEVFVMGGGTAQPGSELEYAIRATNIGTLPATRVTVTDDLSPLAGKASYVAGSGTLNGSTAGVSYAGSVLAADYASTHGDLAPGASAVVRFRVRIDPATAIGTTIGNTGVVSWSDPPRTESASVSIDVGGTPGSGTLGGRVWHDASLDKIYDAPEAPLSGWSIELYRAGRLHATVLTDRDGIWRLSGLSPNEGTSEPYELRFRASGAGPTTASLGTADSPFTNGPQSIGDVTVASGGNLQGLNLPITPNGAVYDSVQRTPVAGARLAMVNASSGAPLPERCFDDPAQQNQSTASDGFYKFDLNFSDPACSPGDTYFIDVTPPAAGYMAMPSQIIPPNGASADPFSVPDCPGSPDDAVPSTAAYCEATASALVPPSSVEPRTVGTVYHLYMTLSNASIPGGSQIFNNHIPVDPELGGAVAITKTSSLVNVSKGQLVPYTITVTNVLGAPLYDMAVVDHFPAGFKYMEGSARLDGEKRDPTIGERELLWDGLELQANGKHTLQLLLVVGAGVSEGEYVNRAQVLNTATGGSVSGQASASVRVVPDPTFDCTDVIGKVFDDRNLDGFQEDGEEGLPGVSVVTARGLIGTTDAWGRFHIACAAVPDEDRGSNFILKLDDRTLPTGYRMTTENPRVQRATRGKMLKFDFGATIHRVVSIDIAEGAFEPQSTEIRLQWKPRIGELLEELKKKPSVLRLSYLADVEREGLVKRRLKALKKEIADRWERSEGGYRLTIETEVFWRRGGPAR